MAFLYAETKNKTSYSNRSCDIYCERSNLLKVTLEIVMSYIG